MDGFVASLEKKAKDVAEKAAEKSENGNSPMDLKSAMSDLSKSDSSGTPDSSGKTPDSEEKPNPLAADADPSTKGSDARQEAANDIMCSEFQKLFHENQTRYQEFIMRSLENYFQEKHTKVILDKMLNRNMAAYIKSNQFSGIIKSEIEKSIGSVMQTSLRSGLRNKKNYQRMCNDIDKMVATRGGATRSKRKTKRKTLKRLKN
jgi:hypothetical protein